MAVVAAVVMVALPVVVVVLVAVVGAAAVAVVVVMVVAMVVVGGIGDDICGDVSVVDGRLVVIDDGADGVKVAVRNRLTHYTQYC